MNEVKVLNIGGIHCYEKNGTAYLRLEEVARGLGFTRIAESGNEVIRWERVNGYLSDLGVPTCGHDDYIPENIFYRLAMKAKNEAAERFQAKVADVIIPSIRRYGGYISGQDELSDDELMAKALLVAQKKIEDRDRMLAEKDRHIAKLEPKADFYDTVATAGNAISIAEAAKLINIKGIGQNNLFRFLRDRSVLDKRNKPMQKYVNQGWFKLALQYHEEHGEVVVTTKTLVYPKGIDGIRRMLTASDPVIY